MIYMVDIDDTICLTNNSEYENAIPLFHRIKKINELYQNNNTIIYFTARGSKSKKDWKQFTEKQLDDWGCLRHLLITGKPHYDVWIDDKAISSTTFFNTSSF